MRENTDQKNSKCEHFYELMFPENSLKDQIGYLLMIYLINLQIKLF